jgi:hypothetical protein
MQQLLQPVAAEIVAAGEMAEQRRSPCFQVRHPPQLPQPQLACLTIRRRAWC